MTWPLNEFLADLADARVKLERLWPEVRVRLPALAEPDRRARMTAWNALVYVQQGLELQVVAALRDRYGAQATKYADRLGVFADIPFRGAVPRLEVQGGGAALGALPAVVTIGAWALLGLLVSLAVLRVTGVLELVQQHFTSARQYETYVEAMRKLGKAPEPPREGSGIGWGGLLLLGGAAGGAYFLARRRAA